MLTVLQHNEEIDNAIYQAHGPILLIHVVITKNTLLTSNFVLLLHL